ncbi:MAG: LacI family DNA-binding transcriptional regulator [Thermomicrobiales bacterium]|nr:LacI family DNA-binding transcriptional regulator [Thermomicrobiales bacterium]
MSAPAPTIRDVARAAGVGVGTVSRVLSGQPSVAPATRARVEMVIARLGYYPNAAARALSRQHTDTVEVAVPLVARDFYVEILRGIEIALQERGLSLLIRTVEGAVDRDRVFTALAAPGRADGSIIVSQLPPPEVMRRLTAERASAVLVDGQHQRLPSVAVDHTAAALRAVNHLIGLGHRRIAHIDHPESPFAQGSPAGRRQGYQAALGAAGLPVRADDDVVAELSAEGGAAALAALLARPAPPSAVFVGSDTQAAGVLAAAPRLGRRVPADLAVVGYNDIELAGYLDLTTVRVPMRDMGRLGVELLMAAMAQPREAPPVTLLSAEFVVRGSSGG